MICWRCRLLFKWNIELILGWYICTLIILRCRCREDVFAAITARLEKEGDNNEGCNNNDEEAINDHVPMVRSESEAQEGVDYSDQQGKRAKDTVDFGKYRWMRMLLVEDPMVYASKRPLDQYQKEDKQPNELMR